MHLLAERDTVMPIVNSLLRKNLIREGCKLHEIFIYNTVFKTEKNNCFIKNSFLAENISYIMDHHSNFISINIENMKFHSLPSILGKENHYVFVENSDKNLCIFVNFQKLFICEHDNLLFFSEEKNNKTLYLEDIRIESNIYYIKTSIGYIVARPDTSVNLNSPNCLEWEHFTCLPNSQNFSNSIRNFDKNCEILEDIAWLNSVEKQSIVNDNSIPQSPETSKKKNILKRLLKIPS
ncbi:hypothetical protein HK14_15305 [Acetobacter cibinongensis]|uniref:Uncharacterized protein n=2 Tax=Acetobacter cibinongensis TaxID=146475 RepID=A0A1Z5YRB1_9PROT|nr:hypothetical protein HK14_15305 [Acetobacter cibinongensis]